MLEGEECHETASRVVMRWETIGGCWWRLNPVFRGVAGHGRWLGGF